MVRGLSLCRKCKIQTVLAADTKQVWENNLKLSHKLLFHSPIHSFIQYKFIESYDVTETMLGYVERAVNKTWK